MLFNFEFNIIIHYIQDSDIYRLCIDRVRPSLAERSRGKIPPGIYLRDIAEIREGADSYDFTNNENQPKSPDHCLSILGSETTISLEFPSEVHLRY